MAEIHRVPLLPIARGSLIKLWLGVAVALLLGGGIAWAARSHDVRVETLTAGSGPSPGPDALVQFSYVGKLESGKEFDKGDHATMDLQNTIPGFRDGLTKMQKGGKYLLTIPCDKAYGCDAKLNPQTGEVLLPANSDLMFTLELHDFLSREEAMRRQQMMQQLQQMQGGPAGPGGPGGPPPGAGAPPPPQ